jgi:hypothetical protein
MSSNCVGLEHASAWNGTRSVRAALERPRWLMSGPADFSLVCAGGGALLLLMALVLVWHGDQELDIADLLLSELHLGATYGAIARRRLWRRMPAEVVAVPVVILFATYALALRGWSVLAVTGIVYVGAWHRSRQNLGIARHYQRLAGGPLSRSHQQILAAAIYLPMIAAVAYFTSTSPLHEGDEYLALVLPPCSEALPPWPPVSSRISDRRRRAGMQPNRTAGPCTRRSALALIANAVGLASAYMVGAWVESFVLVLVFTRCSTCVPHSIRHAATDGAPPSWACARISCSSRRSRTWPVLGISSFEAPAEAPGSARRSPSLTAGLHWHTTGWMVVDLDETGSLAGRVTSLGVPSAGP